MSRKLPTSADASVRIISLDPFGMGLPPVAAALLARHPDASSIVGPARPALSRNGRFGHAGLILLLGDVIFPGWDHVDAILGRIANRPWRVAASLHGFHGLQID